MKVVGQRLAGQVAAVLEAMALLPLQAAQQILEVAAVELALVLHPFRVPAGLES